MTLPTDCGEMQTLESLLPDLVKALRDELVQYGEMLALLEEQQVCVQMGSGGGILQATLRLNHQTKVIQSARQARIALQQRVLNALGHSLETPFGNVLQALPPKYFSPLAGLIRENGSLQQRVQQRLRENHAFLARSIEMLHPLLDQKAPSEALRMDQAK